LGIGIVLLLTLIIILLAVTSSDVNDEINFNNLLSTEWTNRLIFYPEFATFIDDNSQNANLTNFSLDSINQRTNFYNNLYAQLNKINFANLAGDVLLNGKDFILKIKQIYLITPYHSIPTHL
jgi:hypothetical protein